MTPALTQAFDNQVRHCRSLNSPFSADLLEGALQDIEVGGAAAELVRPWADSTLERVISDAVALRLLGAVHALKLTGETPLLAAHFPAGSPGDGAAAWAAARDLIVPRHAHFVGFMAHEPQTNEVGRAALLLLGFMAVSQAFGLPLRVVELGASAGLNQAWDRFRYDLGGVTWGPPDSPVSLQPAWRGPLPELTEVRVSSRRACDRRPVDITIPAQAQRLQAYVWADQPERLERLTGAIGLAKALGVTVEAADALAFVRREAAPRPGVATVVCHTVFWPYMPPETQAAVRSTIEGFGRAATSESPFGWLRMESPPDFTTAMETRLTLWPGGDEQLLATSHPHGTWIRPA